jgi:multisubunit Na+/H+ antiporter MnhE subunit
MAFWVWVDDSLMLAELLAGAGAAAIGASMAELVQYQSATHFRLRVEWVAYALRLPLKLVKDLAIVMVALWRRLAYGEDPPGGFRAIPVSYGDDSPEGVTRRLLVIGGTSFTPNTFALGIDRERELMVVHDLVTPGAPQGRRGRRRGR